MKSTLYSDFKKFGEIIKNVTEIAVKASASFQRKALDLTFLFNIAITSKTWTIHFSIRIAIILLYVLRVVYKSLVGNKPIESLPLM